MLVAVTDDDARNLVACQVAKHKFNVPRTIARVTNPKNENIFKILGVDVTVCSTKLILAHIEQELPSHPLIPLLELKSSGLEIIEVKIPPGSKVVGKKLRSFSLPKGSAVLLIISKEKGPQIPTPDTVVMAEDEVVAITQAENEEAIRAILGSK
jgi:trk system potassium uptake protein TrkA